MGNIYIFSDIHFGLDGAQEKLFERFCKRLEKEDTLILLGDIVDFWIDRKMDLISHIWPKYEKVIDMLEQSKCTDIHYIPGNHDSFVFDVEGFRIAGPQISGVERQIDGVTGLQAILMALEQVETYTRVKAGFGSVCTIHYPYYYRKVNGKKFLFTHGHYHRLLWRLLDGVPTLPSGVAQKILSGVSIVAHAHKRVLRRLYLRVTGGADQSNETDGSHFDDTNAVQNISIYVTNETLRGMRNVNTLESADARTDCYGYLLPTS